MPGPKPTPTVIKLQRGNPGKRPVNKAEPQGKALTKLPNPPAMLKKIKGATAIYRAEGQKLLDAGIFTDLDVIPLTQLAVWVAKWQDAETQLAREEMVLMGAEGGLYQNPYVSIAKNASEMVNKYTAVLGLTPADRTRIKIAPSDDGNDFFD